MYLEAQLPKAAIESAIRQFAPIRIHMTPTDEDTHWIELDEPQRVEMVPEVGVRVICKGRVRYRLAGVPMRFPIKCLSIILRPVVDDIELCFHLDIEDADLKHVPGIVDKGIMKAVNEALTPNATKMIWNFGRTLSTVTSMPVRLEPLDEFHVQAKMGNVTVDGQSIRFRVALKTDLTRYKEEPSFRDPPDVAEVKAAQSAESSSSNS